MLHPYLSKGGSVISWSTDFTNVISANRRWLYGDAAAWGNPYYSYSINYNLRNQRSFTHPASLVFLTDWMTWSSPSTPFKSPVSTTDTASNFTLNGRLWGRHGGFEPTTLLSSYITNVENDRDTRDGANNIAFMDVHVEARAPGRVRSADPVLGDPLMWLP